MELLFLIITAICFYLILTYNNLVRKRNHVQEGWSGIDIQLKRRYNLIPNLVETVKGYAEHEQSIFEELTRSRANTQPPVNLDEKAELEFSISSGISRLLAVAENYPELKASANFSQLQTELNEIENQIQLARRYYNGATREYNTLIQSFPVLLFANACGFKKSSYFQLDTPMEQEAPKIDIRSNS